MIVKVYLLKPSRYSELLIFAISRAIKISATLNPSSRRMHVANAWQKQSYSDSKNSVAWKMACYPVTMVAVRISPDVVLVSKLVVPLMLACRRAERFSSDFLVIRDDRFATVQIAVHVSPGYPPHSHGLSVHRQISVLLHAVSVRLFPRFVLQRLQRITSVDAFHRCLPSFVEHLPHLEQQVQFL